MGEWCRSTSGSGSAFRPSQVRPCVLRPGITAAGGPVTCHFASKAEGGPDGREVRTWTDSSSTSPSSTSPPWHSRDEPKKALEVAPDEYRAFAVVAAEELRLGNDAEAARLIETGLAGNPLLIDLHRLGADTNPLFSPVVVANGARRSEILGFRKMRERRRTSSTSSERIEKAQKIAAYCAVQPATGEKSGLTRHAMPAFLQALRHPPLKLVKVVAEEVTAPQGKAIELSGGHKAGDIVPGDVPVDLRDAAAHCRDIPGSGHLDALPGPGTLLVEGVA